MTKKNPFHIIKHLYVTEKSVVLENLKNGKSNPSLLRCELPKYVFIVDKSASKTDVAHAVEEIYKNKNVKVTKVNTLNVKPKTRRVRGRTGERSAFKKAIVTFQKGDSLDNL